MATVLRAEFPTRSAELIWRDMGLSSAPGSCHWWGAHRVLSFELSPDASSLLRVGLSRSSEFGDLQLEFAAAACLWGTPFHAAAYFGSGMPGHLPVRGASIAALRDDRLREMEGPPLAARRKHVRSRPPAAPAGPGGQPGPGHQQLLAA